MTPALVSGELVAQTASEITPSTFRPDPQRLTGAVVFSGETGLAAPEGADRLSVTIAGVDVEGTLPGLEETTAALEARLTRGPIRVSEIFEAASALEAAYVEAGFILARVVLPAQELRDGDRLRLVVVDGFVETIDTTAVPEEVRDRIIALTESLIGKRGLRQRELERQLLLAGDTYGISLGSVLDVGASPGGTVIILQPRYRQVTGFVGFDNRQTDALGEWSLNAGAEFNGFLGFGEALYARATGYPGDGYFSSTPRNRSFALGAALPVGTDGLSFNLEYTNSRTAPDTPGATTNSEFERLSFRAFYPVVRSRAFNVTGQVSLDIQEDRLELGGSGGTPVYIDETSVLRVSADALWLPESGGVFEAGAILSFGLDALGARTAADAAATSTGLSRPGADAEFSKLELSGRARWPLQENIALTLAGRAQISFGDPLLTSEQIGIATISELSAFDDGTLNGDSGWVLRSELSSIYEMEVANYQLDLRPYAFIAAGALHREAPVVPEAGTVHAESFGIGIEAFRVRDQAFSTASVRLELANGSRDDGGADGTRITLFGSLRF